MKHSWIVKLGCLVVGGKRLGSGLSVDPTETPPYTVRHILQFLEKLGDSFTQSAGNLRYSRRRENHKGHSKNDDPVPGTNEREEGRRICKRGEHSRLTSELTDQRRNRALAANPASDELARSNSN